MKEVRLLWWPWSLMMFGGLFPLIKLFLPDQGPGSGMPELVAVFGFFGGAALLTAMCFRPAQGDLIHEYPAVPLEPSRLWQAKMSFLVIAVMGAAVIAVVAQAAFGMITWRELKSHDVLEPTLLLIIITCSTGFWTVLARSVVGGVLLTGVAQLMLYVVLVIFVRTLDRLAPVEPGETRLSHLPEVHAALSWFFAGVGLTYAGVMLWLGRRKCEQVGWR